MSALRSAWLRVLHGPCTCGDKWEAHQHYRTGTDCSLCPCGEYQDRRWYG